MGHLLDLLLQVARTKAEQDLLEKYEINETKADNEHTSKLYICNIFGNSFIYYLIFKTIPQSVTFSSMILIY